MSGRGSTSEEDGDAGGHNKVRASGGMGSRATTGAASRRRSRSRSRSDARVRFPVQLLVEVEEIESVKWWQIPILKVLGEYRTHRCRRGMLRHLQMESLCTGMCTESSAMKALLGNF